MGSMLPYMAYMDPMGYGYLVGDMSWENAIFICGELVNEDHL